VVFVFAVVVAIEIAIEIAMVVGCLLLLLLGGIKSPRPRKKPRWARVVVVICVEVVVGSRQRRRRAVCVAIGFAVAIGVVAIIATACCLGGGKCQLGKVGKGQDGNVHQFPRGWSRRGFNRGGLAVGFAVVGALNSFVGIVVLALAAIVDVFEFFRAQQQCFSLGVDVIEIV